MMYTSYILFFQNRCANMKLHKRCCQNQEGKEKNEQKLGVVLAAAMAVTKDDRMRRKLLKDFHHRSRHAAATTAAEAAADKAAADGSEAKVGDPIELTFGHGTG